MRLENNVHDVALVFEGGGMRASYSSGVLAALLEAEVHCDWVGGISAGSSCTVNYLSRQSERARISFTDIAAEPQFGGWNTFVRGKGMFNAEWIYEHTSGPDQLLPFDMAALHANPAQCAIGAVRCDDGEMVYWGRDDLTDLTSVVKRVRASSTMPILMPWTVIDGVAYADGALGPTGGFALDAAKAAGYRRFIVVTTRERGYRKPTVKRPRALRSALRRYPAVADGLLERPANYNRTLDELMGLESSGDALLLFPERMPITNNERSVAKLQAIFDQGLAQGRARAEAIRDFVGLP